MNNSNKREKEPRNPSHPRLYNQKGSNQKKTLESSPIYIHKHRSITEANQALPLLNPEQKTRLDRSGYEKLVNMNEQYLIEKNDVPKPSKFCHKMPFSTGKSEYFLRYGINKTKLPQTGVLKGISGTNLKFTGAPIAGYQSIYNSDFRQKASDASLKQHKKKYKPSDAPTFNLSSYNRDFSTIMASPTESAKRVEIKLMGGGKLADDTTYRHCYSKRDSLRPLEPIIYKDNRIFMSLDKPLENASSYQSTFRPQENKKGPLQSFKPIHKYNPSRNQVRYKTEYSGEYTEQPLKDKKGFECLTHEQLRDYVMNVLQD